MGGAGGARRLILAAGVGGGLAVVAGARGTVLQLVAGDAGSAGRHRPGGVEVFVAAAGGGTLKVNLGVPGGPTSVTLTVTARLADLVEGASSAAFTVTLYWVVPLS